jgi:hypothetical protein
MNIGDYFRVVHKGHWAFGQTHRCAGLPNLKVKGEPVLDLGCLVEFVIEDHFGQPCHHVIPVEWAQPVERPSVKRRVKSAAFDEGSKPEFWNDMYAACRNKGEG